MLPSSHLILHESPQEAAKGILKEQLEIKKLELTGPQIFSDVYEPEGRPIAHWDIGFIFMGQLAERNVPKPDAWTDLRFIDVTVTKKTEFARSHEDVLTFAGKIKIRS